MNNLDKLKFYADFILKGKEINKVNVNQTIRILQHILTHLSHQKQHQRFNKIDKGFAGHNLRKTQREILSQQIVDYLELKIKSGGMK